MTFIFKIIKLNLFKWLLILLPIYAFSIEQSSLNFEQQTINLQRYWIQDRFIRTVSLAQTDEEKLLALNQLLILADISKSTNQYTSVNVTSKKELDQARDNYLHPKGSTQKEILKFKDGELPLKVIVTGDEALTSEITSINLAYKKLLDHEFSFPPKGMLAGFLKFVGIIQTRQVGFFDLIFENSRDSNLAVKAIKSMSSTEKLKYLNQLQSQIDMIFETIRNSGTAILEKSNISIKDPKTKRFIEIILSQYFQQLPDETLWKIIFLQMERPEIESLMERFQLFSRNVGPHFHKLFQVVSTDQTLPPDLAKIFKSFQESLPAAPEEAVKAELRKSNFQEFEIIQLNTSPSKVGSMAQIHQAKVRFLHNNQMKNLAIRVINPEVHEMLEKDNQFIENLVELVKNDPLLSEDTEGVDYSKKVEELKFLVIEELDGIRTFNNQKQAIRLLQSREVIKLDTGTSLIISVPEAYMSTNPNVMASDWVDGESLESYFERNPEKGQQVAEALFKNWMEKAILTTGFIHADMQMGNIKIDSNLANDMIHAHILDYGMAGVIGPEGRQLFILLSMGTVLKNSRLISRAIWSQAINKPANMSIEELEKIIDDIIAKHAPDSQPGLLEKTIFGLIKKGFVFESNFVKLARGFITAKGLLTVTGSEKKTNELVMEILRKNPLFLQKALGSLKHLEWTDAGGLSKGARNAIGNSIQEVIANPEKAIAAGKAALSAGKSLFGKLRQLKQQGLEKMTEVTEAIEKGRESGNWLQGIENLVLSQTSSSSNKLSYCKKFYSQK